MTGTLILAATPLGNPADASSRLIQALADADLVAAEDTRRLRRLLADLGLHREGPVISFYEAVEDSRWPAIESVLDSGGTVLITSDAGMPAVCDPGFRAARAAIAAGHRVSALPGPSAVTTALAVSGLPSDRFCFEGFLPRGAGQRARRLAELADEPRTMVLFESPRRLAETLDELRATMGDQRLAAVCRELTKVFEEVVRGTLAELAGWAQGGVRGEITLVVGGATPADGSAASPEALARQVAALQAQGVPRKEAMAVVARAAGVPRRSVFDAVVAARAEGEPPAREPDQ